MGKQNNINNFLKVPPDGSDQYYVFSEIFDPLKIFEFPAKTFRQEN